MAKVALTSTGGRRKNGLTWSMGGWGRPAWTAVPCALFSSWLKAPILWTSLSTDSTQTSLSRPSNGCRFAHSLWTKSNREPFIRIWIIYSVNQRGGYEHTWFIQAQGKAELFQGDEGVKFFWPAFHKKIFITSKLHQLLKTSRDH